MTVRNLPEQQIHYQKTPLLQPIKHSCSLSNVVLKKKTFRFVCSFKGVLMTGSLCMSRGILQTVKTLSVQCLEKIRQRLSAWKPHMPPHSVRHHLQCLFARNAQSWLHLTFLMKNFWLTLFSQWERCVQLVKQRNVKDKANHAASCAFLMAVSRITG